MPHVIRRAEARDLDALVELRRLMFEAMGTTDNGPWLQNARDWYAARLDDPTCCFIVVEVDGVVVSCACGLARDATPSPSAPRPGDVLISNVCTLAEYRGRGYARAAFDALMAWTEQIGAARLELIATPDGRPMYDAAGFVPTAHPAMRLNRPS